MDPQTHIIDPDGDLIIVLHNADSLFAQMPEDMIPGKFFDNLPEPVKNEPLPLPRKLSPALGEKVKPTSRKAQLRLLQMVGIPMRS
ncbi:hypothetical protein N7493_007602 [Penicillium malachiteum]|uniref:Uncharacterized protein n=1 Tax=Penicillium malachiteum TaxID=1324776 RepID=A0AAD6HIB8_9EURO|nr:hypothetical protein N7493_007602 [Penicillium malachiteum]